MSAYMVFTRTRTMDPKELEIYSKMVPPSAAGHPIKRLAFYGAHEDLEGPATEGTVILEFPTMEAAKAWYNSPLYREAREHRFQGSDYRVTLVQGI